MAYLSLMVLAAGRVGAEETADVWRASLPAPQVHPCLAFTQEDIPRLKERVQRPPYADWYASVQAGRNVIEQAFLWNMTGEESWAEAVKERLLASNPTGYHCGCGAAAALQGVAEAYDMIFHYPGLSADDHRVIRAKIAAACEKMVRSALNSGPGQHPGNQRVRGLAALGTAALVLGDYTDAAHTPQEWLQRALDGIRQEANLQFWRDDGMFIEGPTYSSFTLSVLLPFARYYHRSTGKYLFAEPRLRNALLYLVYITQPDGLCAAIGTTNSDAIVPALRLAVGAGEPGDQALFRFALDQWGGLGSGGVREICLFDDTVKPSPDFHRPSRFFPVSQEAALRSDWSKYAVALWFKGKDPWLTGIPVYSHGDVGSFVLHAYGELLAVDAGYDHWVSYNLYVPELHNTLLVNGQGPVSETPGLMKRTMTSPFVEGGDIVASYGEVDVTRRFLFVDSEYVVVFDDLRSPQKNLYQWQLHSPVTREQGTIDLNEKRVSWTGFNVHTNEPGRIALDTVWAGPVTVRPMEKSRWQPFGASPETDSYNNWAVVAEQRAKDCRYLTVLFPHPLHPPPYEGGARGGTLGMGEVAPQITTPEAEGGLCAVVEGDGFRDLALAPQGERATYGSLSTTCRSCLVREVQGEPLWLAAGGPGRVEWAGRLLLEVDGEANVAVCWKDGVREPEGYVVEKSAVVYVGGPPGVTITVPTAYPPHAVYRNIDGVWKRWNQLIPEFMPTRVTFRVPPDADQPTTVALDYPPPGDTDGKPPEITSVEVDKVQHVAPGPHLDLGRPAKPPQRVSVRFVHRGLPFERYALDPSSIRVRLNGARAEQSGVRVTMGTMGSGPGPYLRVTAELPEASVAAPVEYFLTVSAANATPTAPRTCFSLRFTRAPLLTNGGFEQGGPTPKSWGAGGAAWSLGTWSSDAETKYEMGLSEDRPHGGRSCLRMRGLAGMLNLVASQAVDLTPGRRYALRGFYRSDAAVVASALSDRGDTEYLWSPAFPPTPEWQEFSWEFTLAKPARSFLVALRLGSMGTAYWDDVTLEEVSEE